MFKVISFYATTIPGLRCGYRTALGLTGFPARLLHQAPFRSVRRLSVGRTTFCYKAVVALERKFGFDSDQTATRTGASSTKKASVASNSAQRASESSSATLSIAFMFCQSFYFSTNEEGLRSTSSIP